MTGLNMNILRQMRVNKEKVACSTVSFEQVVIDAEV